MYSGILYVCVSVGCFYMYINSRRENMRCSMVCIMRAYYRWVCLSVLAWLAVEILFVSLILTYITILLVFVYCFCLHGFCYCFCICIQKQLHNRYAVLGMVNLVKIQIIGLFWRMHSLNTHDNFFICSVFMRSAKYIEFCVFIGRI